MIKIILTTSLFFNGIVFAQFKKYKSKTKINKIVEPKTKPSINTKEPSIRIDTEEKLTEQNIFGRKVEKQPIHKIKKNKLNVNLNPETAFGPEVIKSFDFPKTSIIELTKHMQKLTGINLILDKEIKGVVSISAASPITVGDAWKAYLTALNMNGYSLVKSGAFYKIVQTRAIRYTPTKIYTGNYSPNTDNYVMRVIPLKNISSSEIARSFRTFSTRYGRIVDIKETNTVIAQDTGENINRLVRLIKFVDVPGHEESLQIIPVHNSSAQEIATLLDKILRPRRFTSRNRSRGNISKRAAISRIIAEPRTNSIIAMVNDKGAKKLRSLIKKLDIKSISKTSDRIHVYYLNHGDAETLSKTLSSLISSSKRTTRNSRTRRRSILNQNNEQTLFNSDVKITADKTNNALVITASATDYLTIKKVLKKLDIPKQQVYVEGLIMETQISKARSYGVSYMGVYGSGNARKYGFNDGNSGLIDLLTNNITKLGGLFIGSGVGRSIEFDPGTGNRITVNSLNALISAIASNSNTNVLATPQILALDNQESIFEAGENIPIPKKTDTANGSSTLSIEQQKVGITLKITPNINKVTRFIKLKIDQKIQDFSARALPEGVASQGVATTERAAVTTVVVRDRDTIAMGGLMRDREVDSVSKVPLLGDIPLLGWLFKNKTKEVQKVNLLFFMTPRILASYQKDNAENVKDVLNRRAFHLKQSVKEDPSSNTAKALYDKANKQKDKPLYDETSKKYNNEEGEIQIQEDNDSDKEEDILDLENPTTKNNKKTFEVPDYQGIINKLHKKGQNS